MYNNLHKKNLKSSAEEQQHSHHMARTTPKSSLRNFLMPAGAASLLPGEYLVYATHDILTFDI
jgi:hypothetical protein